ncbi:MAG: hypothetical protein L6R30_20485 [Thermoanaerobaculia bacterium]|nr:hypothetical protein [Thermoanaerobaculia bacterium]
MGTSKEPDSSISTVDSRPVPEVLDLDLLPAPRTPEEAEALEKNRPGPMSLVEYAEFVTQFHWTKEQLAAIPIDDAPRFTLNDD